MPCLHDFSSCLAQLILGGATHFAVGLPWVLRCLVASLASTTRCQQHFPSNDSQISIDLAKASAEKDCSRNFTISPELQVSVTYDEDIQMTFIPGKSEKTQNVISVKLMTSQENKVPIQYHSILKRNFKLVSNQMKKVCENIKNT